MAGTIALIMASMFFTENYLKSPGVEESKETFICLVNYLEKHHIKDEYFNEAKAYKISNENCSDVVSRTIKTFGSDLNERLNFCDYNYDENILLKQTTSLDSVKQNQLTECYECVSKVLKNHKYNKIRLHAAAVSVTIINLKIWKYFTISSAVNELMNHSYTIENRYLSECIEDKICTKNINFCS